RIEATRSRRISPPIASRQLTRTLSRPSSHFASRGDYDRPMEFKTDSFRSEMRDGMRIDSDVPIKMDDGVVLRCDVYRPIQDGKYPVIITYGPYAKWLHFEQIYKTCWDKIDAEHPDVPAAEGNRFKNWEVVDPEKWVPDGYACVRVDSRGCGRSP